MKSKALKTKGFVISTLISAAFLFCISHVQGQSGYVKGDFHQHTTYTDGQWSFQHMMSQNDAFGLDWWANSEHGGGWSRDAAVSGIDKGTTVYWDQYDPNPIIGDPGPLNYGHLPMWRWQILKDYSFPQLLIARQNYPSKVIIQGYEWNVPGHEHGSVGNIDNQFGSNPNVNPLAEFEYKFDNSDIDINGGVSMGWTKSLLSGHAKTLEAIQWLQSNYPFSSWAIPAHPERQKKYTVSHFRDMNNAGPDVCFGFESMPGHQRDPQRGSYGTNSDGGGTYGGVGTYAATIGGLWDAMLSEGRHWWLFASSDFHDLGGDFYPGEYQKTFTWVYNTENPASIVDGLRSGNSFVVEGDLIDVLEFEIHRGTGGIKAEMGETLKHGSNLQIKIKIQDPSGNNNFGENPVLNHFDLIMGDVNGFIDPLDPQYGVPSVGTSHVIARFDAVGGVTDANGITSIPWTIDPQGNITVVYVMKALLGKHYFRLRGTNHTLNVSGETDANGNPLLDIPGQNNTNKAIHDLWFYSNPIFTERDPSVVPLNNLGIILGGVMIALLFVLRRKF